METKAGKFIFFLAALVGNMAAHFILYAAGCQPPQANTSPQPSAQTPVALGPVVAEGTCKGNLGIDLQVGIFALPIRATLDTHASPGGAAGVVSLDIAGLLQAECTVLEGQGACAVSGLLAPRAVEAVAPLTVGGADATP